MRNNLPAWLGAVLALACACPAFAEGTAPHTPNCHPLAKVRADVAEVGGGPWTLLNAYQLKFARELYVALPPANLGLPRGDTAFISMVPGHYGAAVIFTDGDQSCGVIFGLKSEFIEELIELGKGGM